MDVSKMNILEYVHFIAKSLIQLLTQIFTQPVKAVKNPQHLFAIGHIILIIGILMPSGTW